MFTHKIFIQNNSKNKGGNGTSDGGYIWVV
jgi:hypothetical protein